MNKISIVITTFNRKEPLLRTLASLLAQDAQACEIIIVDQNSQPDDGLLSFIQEHCDTVHYIKSTTKGAALGRNVGWPQAKGDIILFCDDDIVALPTLVSGHLGCYADSHVGGVAGRVLTDNDKPVKLGARVGRIRHFDGKMWSNFNADFSTEVEHIWGCNMSFRKALIERAGGFDERLVGTSSFDDADLTFGVSKLGYKILFSPLAAATHVFAKEGGCHDLSFAEKMYWYYHNFMIFYLKHLPKIYFLFFLLRQFGGIIRRALIIRDVQVIRKGVCGLMDGWYEYKRDRKAKRFRARFNKEKVRRILLTRTQSIGDVINFIPTLKVMRENFPQAHISILTGRPWGKELMESCPLVDEVLYFPYKGLPRFAFEKIRFIRLLRKKRFDLVVASTVDIGFALKAFLIAAPYRIGFCEFVFPQGTSIKDKFAFLYSATLVRNSHEHEIDMNLKLISLLGVEDKGASGAIWVSPEDKAFAEQLFRKYGLNNTPSVIVNAFANTDSYNWPQEKYAQLIRYLLTTYELSVVLVGSDRHQQLNDGLAKMVGLPVCNLAGKTTVGQFIALINESNLFIGNNSGPSHIAAALDKPSVVFFGRLNAGQYAPRGTHCIVIHKRKEGVERIDNDCVASESLRSIELAEAIKAVAYLLDNVIFAKKK
ncbi:MAG: glycosyltransferase family 9 protein [Candidatus Omnitrophota bacterium]